MSKIVVGVDGSEESAQALSWAADEARLRDSQLEGLAMEGIERSQSQPGARAAEEMAREHADALVRSMLARRGRGATYCGRRAQPAPYLVERSKDAELLVVGSRGRGSVGSMLLGSVSTHCVHHAECPVVVIK